MTFRLACGDVLPGCPASFENDDRSALLGDVASHAGEAHGLTEIPPEVLAVVESRIERTPA